MICGTNNSGNEALLKANLIETGVEDGIVYINSTLNSSAYSKKHLNEIREFVLDTLNAVASGTAEGATKALLNEVAASTNS